MIVPNDTDLVDPVRHVSKRLAKDVQIMKAVPHPARRLGSAAGSHQLIRYADMARAHFSDEVVDGEGRTLRKPDSW